MANRHKARKSGNYEHFKVLRNATSKLVKRDKIQRIMRWLKGNSGLQRSWEEAKAVFGQGRGTSLSNCTTNNDPKDSAQHQYKFFVEK